MSKMLTTTSRSFSLLEYYKTNGTWHNDGQFKWWTSYLTELKRKK